ncbi:RNA polymerase sigma factor [Phytomonospora endophytica]|uniref:RNA polymerase sigma factor (Sigma-70 family) n=1 Tax=Phytomonospora endophytica TaxID=714109 RepID=A0A841FS50_9ACTN|nr:RNA polymerase sigma factor [Phytomonospora endophytica]MBB6039085.1 RNA polymerase sigma factor (sigma-70 family) [Phytomonospora endophytica]GIG65586.1 DNA-directed RNA polymerase sigma-70 factor [Phytomonospora endophytica]
MTDETNSGGDPQGAAARRAELVKRARDHDKEALDTLITDLTPLLWRVARAQGVDRHTAEDVVQDTWLRFCGRLHTIHTPEAVVAWLTTVARREAGRQRREAGRERPAEDVLGTVLDEAMSEPGADEIADPDREERVRRLREAIGKLPERCRVLVQVIAAGDVPDYGVIATALGMPRGAIGPTRGRCLAKLRGLMGEARG